MPTLQPVAGYPLALFLHRSVFRGPANFSPRPGPPAPPSGPENAGRKGQKSSPPGQLSRRPSGGRPRRPVAAPVETPWRQDRPGPPPGRKAGPERRPRDHPKPREPAVAVSFVDTNPDVGQGRGSWPRLPASWQNGDKRTGNQHQTTPVRKHRGGRQTHLRQM